MAYAAGASGAEVRSVVYFHDDFQHYFMTADAGEIAALDSRRPAGWSRDGQRFLVETEPAAGLLAVCRFLTTAHGGKASHFFTASAAECDLVKGKPDWTYEGIAFHVRLPDGNGCAAGSAPVYRLYNNARGGAPNHAYTPETAQRERLKANGFVEEGVAFCVRTEGEPDEKLQPLLGTTWDFDHTVWGNGLHVMRTAFHSTLGTTPELDALFVALGMPVTGTNASFTTVNSEYREGFVTWDRVSASYLMFVVYTDEIESIYTFDAFDPVKLVVCQYDVIWGGPNEPLPAFQPKVWAGWTPTGCAMSTASRR